MYVPDVLQNKQKPPPPYKVDSSFPDASHGNGVEKKIRSQNHCRNETNRFSLGLVH